MADNNQGVSNILNGILSNPEALSSVLSLLKGKSTSSEDAVAVPAGAFKNESGGLGDILSNPKVMEALPRVMEALKASGAGEHHPPPPPPPPPNHHDDDHGHHLPPPPPPPPHHHHHGDSRINLLKALKPYMRDSRREMIDNMVHIMEIIDLLT